MIDTDSPTYSPNANNISKFRVKGQSYLAEYLPPNMAIELEENIFKYSQEYVNSSDINSDHFKSIYNSKIHDIHFNLNPLKSPTLLSDILNKKISLKTIPYAQSNELNPTLWDPIIKKKEFIEYKKNNMATSDAYECRRCKQRKCKVFLLQTRSADEPMTIFVQCENCNTSFRIYN
jgi:DNA-directed RNA polymerase subunit M/transcription elongation factor TFIIS